MRLMKQITKAEEMIGRTIESAYVESWKAILNLGGGDYVCIEPAHDYEDGVMLEFDGVPSAHDLRAAGILSDEEFAVKEEERKRIRDEHIKAQDLAKLTELRQKYPEWRK